MRFIRGLQKESIVRLDKGGRKISHDKAKEVRGLSLKGVYIAEDSIRYYPFGNFLSHVLGFAGSDNQGLMGLEKYYDKELNGDEGHVRFCRCKGQRMPNVGDDFKTRSWFEFRLNN